MDNAPRFVQRNFYGFPVCEPEPPSPSLIHAAFGEFDVRIVMVKGEPWWYAVDVCKVLDIGNASQAVSYLDDDERSTLISNEGGQQRTVNAINESGLYSLIFKSRKPEAKRFRKWVTSEVLPSIRKTGTYSLRSPRVDQEVRRLKIDAETAEARCKQFTVNKAQNRKLADSGYKPCHIAGYHNAVYVGQFGQKAAALREKLGLKSGQTPLDRMGFVPLMANGHIKAIAAATIESLGGDALPIEKQLEITEQIAFEMAEMDKNRLSHGYHIDLTDHPKRGKIIDVVPSKLISVG